MCIGQKQTFHILEEKVDKHARYIWFHASSLGEFEQGRPMMEKIKSEYPAYKILLTFFSPSGYEVRKNYEKADIVCYLPFDTPRNVRKFIRLANPAMAVFIKYEFWANYLNTLKKQQIPTYIISAIFRKDQLFFTWYGRSYRKVLTCFNRLFVQDDASAKLLGDYAITNVTVAGDTRFDRVMEVFRQAKSIPLVEMFVRKGEEDTFFTLVAGSSWPQDEDFLLPYFNEHQKIKLIIAPHEIHNSHLQQIEAKLKRPFVRLSEANEQSISNADCLIIDSFGLLSSIYRYGEISYIGGGFGKSIHNTLEAAVYGIPVIFGPKFDKFKEAKDLIASGGGFPIYSPDAFTPIMDQLISDPRKLQKAGFAAGNFVKENAGATERITNDILSVLKNKSN